LENQIIDNAKDAIICINLNGVINYCNRAACDLLGYKEHELIGKGHEVLLPEDNKLSFDNVREAILLNETIEPILVEKVGKHQATIILSVQYSPIMDEGDTIVGVSSIMRKIGHFEKEATKAQALLETAPDAIVVVGEEGKILFVNAQVKNLFGYEKDELIGRPIECLIPDRFRIHHADHRSKYFSNTKVRPMGAGLELAGLRKNGEEFPVEISLSPLKTEEGMLVSAAIRDISERKEAQKALEAFNQQLQAKNKELDQFAYVASHDLQEPLKTVCSFTEFLASDYGEHFDDIGKKSMQFITEATGRMQQLIKGLLDYSRIGRDRTLNVVDCNQIINDIKSDLSSYIKESKASFKIGKLPKVKGYETELRLLFQNLITNGIKFRRKDVIPEITITAENKNNQWVFAVKDNGIGIEDKYQERIFIIFQRLHERSKYAGTGIGLAHCQKIAELHGGKVWLESKVNEGSTFYFSIPRK